MKPETKTEIDKFVRRLRQPETKVRRQFGRYRLEYRGDAGEWRLSPLRLGITLAEATALARQIDEIPMRGRTLERTRTVLKDWKA